MGFMANLLDSLPAPQVRDGDLIVVWFSCGAASALAAKLTLDQYGDRCRVRIVNNPISEEDDDNRRFLRDVERWIGVPIEQAINPDFPNASIIEVWEKKRYMAGVDGAPCTELLKKEARRRWEQVNKPHWHVLGFTVDERKRFDNFRLGERENTLPVLIDAGLTKQECADFVVAAGLALPSIYAEGYPNANCPGCVKASSPTYWNLVRRSRPEVFAQRAEMSRRIGAKLVEVKGERIFLDELDPITMGRPLKTLRIECGIFCEEQSA